MIIVVVPGRDTESEYISPTIGAATHAVLKSCIATGRKM